MRKYAKPEIVCVEIEDVLFVSGDLKTSITFNDEVYDADFEGFMSNITEDSFYDFDSDFR